MEQIATDNKLFILRYDKNEDCIAGLITFCQKEGIEAGFFSGLGACSKVTLSYYDLEKKKYLDKTFTEDLEIVSLTGNVARLNHEPAIHAHGVFSDRTYKTYGGHVKQLIVSATCEIHLTKLDGAMNRDFDETTGLNLLQ